MEVSNKRKFNLFDLVIVLVGLAAVLGAGSVLAVKVLKVDTPGAKKEPVEIVVRGGRLEPSVALGIEIGDPLIIKQSGVLVGKITKIDARKGTEVQSTLDGQLVLATSPYHQDVFLTVQASASNSGEGFKIGGFSVKVNQEEIFITRKTSFMGRFWKITELK